MTDSKSMRPFLVIWGGQAVSLLGSQAVQFALLWWLAQTYASAALLSAAAFAALVPQIVLGPLFGSIVDRHDRKRVMLLADAGAALAAAALCGLFLAGVGRPWHVLALLLVRSVAAGLHGPAFHASTALMVPERHLVRVQGLNQALQGGGLIVAAPLGALLASTLPLAGVVAVEVLTAAVAIVPLLATAIPRPDRATPDVAGLRGLLGDLGDALGYLRVRTGHLALVAVAAAVNLWLVPAFALLPLFVSGALGGDAAQFGWMNSWFGIGSLAGGIALTAWGGFRRRIVTSIAGLAALGVAVLALGAAPAGRPVLAVAAMGFVGLTVPFVNGPIQAIFMATIEPRLQGRVLTLMGSVAGLTAPVGLLLAAPLAEIAGVRAWFLGGGVACCTMAAAMAALPAVMRIESATPSESTVTAGGRPQAARGGASSA